MKKRLFSLILVVILICSLGLTSFATEYTENDLILPYQYLPKEYTQISYLESVSGTSYINLGYTPNYSDSFNIKFSCDNFNKLKHIFGLMNNTYFVLQGVSERNTFEFWHFDDLYAVSNLDSNFFSISFDSSINNLINNDVLGSKTYHLNLPHSTNASCYLFLSENWQSPENIKSFYRFYNFTVDDVNNNLIHNYVLCYRNFDNKYGVYDTVSNMFFEVQGEGEWAIGESYSIIHPYDKGQIYPFINNVYDLSARVITCICSEPILLYLFASSLIPFGIYLYKKLRTSSKL